MALAGEALPTERSVASVPRLNLLPYLPYSQRSD